METSGRRRVQVGVMWGNQSSKHCRPPSRSQRPDHRPEWMAPGKSSASGLPQPLQGHRAQTTHLCRPRDSPGPTRLPTPLRRASSGRVSRRAQSLEKPQVSPTAVYRAPLGCWHRSPHYRGGLNGASLSPRRSTGHRKAPRKTFLRSHLRVPQPRGPAAPGTQATPGSHNSP